MKKKTVLLISSIVASLTLVGTTFAAFAVTDNASPFGFNVGVNGGSEDETTYTTLEWGESTVLPTKLENITPGKIYKLGVLSLKSNYVYSGVLTATLTENNPKSGTQKKLIDYVQVYLYEGANTDVEEGNLPSKAALAHTELQETSFVYSNAVGNNAGKEYSLYLSFDESAQLYLSQMKDDVINLEINWNPQSGDIHAGDKNVYFSTSWNKAYLYAWDSDTGVYNAVWPGLGLAKVGTNQYGQYVYKGVLTGTYDMFIFSNGGDGSDNQTPNLSVSSFDFDHGDLLFWKDDTAEAKAGYKVFDAAEDIVGYAGNMGTNPGPILHAWGWTTNMLTNNNGALLDEVANAGYKAIQMGPMQPINTGSSGSVEWYNAYQPLGFKVAESGQSPFGDKNSLKTLTAAAKERGISIIVDVIANHLNGSDGHLYSGVATYESQLYDSGKGTYLHNSGGMIGDDTYWCTKGDFGTGRMPDLKTEDEYVQARVISLLKEYIDCGVKGFRFDAAKHIETPEDGDYASRFWPNVIGAANTYAINKTGEAPYCYGEILGLTGGRNWAGYTDYMDVTDYSGNICQVRDQFYDHSAQGIVGASGYSFINNTAEYAMLMAETHDNFVEGMHSDVGSDAWTNLIYAYHASRADASSLYFSRPIGSERNGNNTRIIVTPSDGYKSAVVKAANRLHNEFNGGSEYLADYGSCVINIRNLGEKIGIFVADLNYGSSATVGNLPWGTYTNIITGATVVINSDELSLAITDGAAVLIKQ